MSATTWHEANQQYLLAELERVAQRFDDKSSAERPDDAADIAARMDPPPPLVELSGRFGLTDFERDVLLLCGGVELDASFAQRCVGDGSPTFAHALSHLAGSHWSAISPGGPLRRWRLIEPPDAGLLTTGTLRIDERVLHHLVGVDHDDVRLSGIVFEPMVGTALVPSHVEIVRRILAFWSFEIDRDSFAVVQLCGDEPRTLIDIASAACHEAGLNLRIAPAHGLPRSAGEIAAFARLWEREAALSSAVLLIDCTGDADLDRESEAVIDRIIGGLDGMIMIATRDRRRAPPLRPVFTVDVQRPTELEQCDVWRQLLGLEGDDMDDEISALSAHFDLGPAAIDTACLEARIHLDADADAAARSTQADIGAALWTACRTQARSGMASLARRLHTTATWDDLVISDEAREMLHSVVRHVRQRVRVYREWGFASRATRGRGIAALFAGPSGTGKTMAAEVLAAELELDLFAIDLSSMVSKYIGETEKNLRQVFDAAESSGAILLFDEADALFGRRSEVKDSHDRFANIEVSYLLQRVESYRGVAILTSNMKDSVDVAFLRRLSFIVDFPFPDAEMRAELWAKVFPPSTPAKDLDHRRLAQLNVSGGSITNIALAAAFLAAESGEPVTMEHIQRATVLEYAKTERHVTPAEMKGWP